MESTSDFGYLLWKTGGSFLIVLTLLLIAAYCLKRWGPHGRKTTEGNWIRILARETLGPKHYLLLVQVQESLLLLGVSPEGIRLLSPVDRALTSLISEPPSAPSPEPQKAFETLMEKFAKNTFLKARREC